MEDPIDIYIHVPFCTSLCRCCGAVVRLGTSSEKADYLKALVREIDAAIPSLSERVIDTVYIGGGTPTCMRQDQLAEVINHIRHEASIQPRAEVTLEAMPHTTCTASLTAIAPAHLTRMSLSMQSYDQSELEALDCCFSIAQLEDAVLFLDRFNCRNLNLDLMYGFDGETRRGLVRTLHAVHNFAPQHVSLYPFDKVARVLTDSAISTGSSDSELRQTMPLSAEGEGNRRDFYNLACRYLVSIGLERYSLYHFAKPGFRCQHFENRYRGKEYRGFGIGARSYIGGVCYRNTADLSTYLVSSDNASRTTAEIQHLSGRQKRIRYLVGRLHLIDGLSSNDYRSRFGSAVGDDLRNELGNLMDEGLVIEEDGDDDVSWKLSQEGLFNPAPAWRMLGV